VELRVTAETRFECRIQHRSTLAGSV